MRVAIEATPLTLTSGGLARYTAELAKALARNFPQDHYALFSDQSFTMPAPAFPNLERGPGPKNKLEHRWWLYGLTQRAVAWKADLIHGPDFSVPYIPRRPSVMTVHDLSPWMDPTWHANADRVRRRAPILMQLGLATMIVTVSETVRKQAIDHFRLQPERVVSIPLAADPIFQPIPNPTRDYFLFVGTIEPRKNVPALLAAWSELYKTHKVPLKIAGRQREDGPQLTPQPGLEILGEVPESNLPALYANARALVYPSHYEGFGLPVLEAMQSGTPVITSKATTEVGGAAPLYAQTEAELTQAMESLLSPEKLTQQISAALTQAKKFNWDRTAQQTHQVYEQARQRFAN